MRKVSLILVVLLFAAPAWADVDIKCECDGNEVTISYRVTEDEPNKVRAFALDITVDNGTITGYDDTVNDDYVIYPGSIVIDTESIPPSVSDYGTPIGDPCDHPDTQPGLDSNGVTIEMGALYAPPNDASPNAPPDPCNEIFYDLLKIYTSETGDYCITISENEARGGVVMTDPTIDPDVNSPGCCAVPDECFPIGYTTYVHYVDYKNHGWDPDCWCEPPDGSGYQCDADADGGVEGIFKYRVYFNDLDIFVANWKKKDSQLPGDCPRPE